VYPQSSTTPELFKSCCSTVSCVFIVVFLLAFLVGVVLVDFHCVVSGV
jgi:hypothetical protein